MNMQRAKTSPASTIFGGLVESALSKVAITEDRHLSRKRALETLDLSLLEYISFAMPSGFKDWTPDIENIKKLEPGQKMLGYMSYYQNGKAIAKSRERLLGNYNDNEDGYEDGYEDEDDRPTACWDSTSLLRLARLGIVTPMVSSAGLQRHNMRCIYAGLIDGFVVPTAMNDRFAVCSFKLPDWRQVLAEDYRNDMRSLVGAHNMLLQDMCYDQTKPEFGSLESRLDALKTFLRGSLSWMLLDLPIGGQSPNSGIFKFDYAFSFQIRRVMQHVENILDGSASQVEYRKHGHSSWYGQIDIQHGSKIVPNAYSGLHGHLISADYKSSLTCESADLRRAVLLALLYPGLLADHGVVSAYIMAKSRSSVNTGVTDLKGLEIREVGRDMQQTVWVNEVTMNVNPYITPNVFNGTIEMNNVRAAGIKTMPIDLMTPTEADHQDVIDATFGAGYVRMSTSKRIGSLVKEAIREVIYSRSIDKLVSVYSKYRDELNKVCPLVEHNPGGGDKVPNAFKHQETISLAPAPTAPDTGSIKHENLAAS